MPVTPIRPSRSIHRVLSSTAGDLVDCRSHLPPRPSPSTPCGAVNSRPTAVAVYSALARRSVCRGQIPTSRVRNKFQGKFPYLWRCPICVKTQHSMRRGKPVRKSQLDPCSRFDTIPACDRQTHMRRRQRQRQRRVGDKYIC